VAGFHSPGDIADWSALRQIMRHVEKKLAQQYKLVPLE
jgi:hypothetical protein